MASLIKTDLKAQQPYCTIKPTELEFIIKYIPGCEDYYIIAKGNSIEGVIAYV